MSVKVMLYFYVFFFNDTATTEIYTLSLHDALPISPVLPRARRQPALRPRRARGPAAGERAHARRHHLRISCRDRESTTLNSTHANISHALFCLKKKKTI